MFILKHLKALQHVSIIIQIIFRKLVYSLLKLLILKFIKNVKSQYGDAAASPHWLFIFLTNFKISNFNKEYTSFLKMIWMMIETYWSVLSVFSPNATTCPLRLRDLPPPAMAEV